MSKPPLNYATRGLNSPEKLWTTRAATTYVRIAAALLFCLILVVLLFFWLVVSPDPPYGREETQRVVSLLSCFALMAVVCTVAVFHFGKISRLPLRQTRALQIIIILHLILAGLMLPATHLLLGN